MTFGKYTLISIATFLIIISGFTVFLLNSDKTTASESTQNESTNSSANTKITINNNIVNNISGDAEVTVNSNITNDLKGDATSEVTNNVENNVEGNGTAHFTNSIENLMSGYTVGSLENLIENNMNGNGDHTLDNSINNALDENVNVDVSNGVNNSVDNQAGNDNGNNEDNEGENGNGNEEGNGDNEEATPPEASGDTVWGIDSASETTDEFFACVRENFGDPVIVGRYLETKEGVSEGLTDDQIELIHAENASILLIYNHFEDATGYDNGVAQAEQAISFAKEIGAPEGVAIFADIEPNYPVDADFIRGWYDTMSDSEYESGIYGVFDEDQDLYQAYNAAVEEDKSILENNYIWTAAPNEGITTEENAPEYNPTAPEGSLAWGWQYGIDSEQCNIDTNLFENNLIDVLWSPK
ncbi:glycoside hydrolase domain-containing protein [Bacillus sp. PS06]|uniref:glycoside hydrolase domain-containing protein n=1 Tax=Bacillus sp. PS06 TaxID=2764176 RepID=UPI00177BA852|nr:glycoside hydrolase domain-containing protein [Bacillus sp. PS06]MBD8070516.1 DUF1906 domain-containing protein [Bacillus sp. PS06]